MRASITWKQCAELPSKLSEGRTTILEGKVYCGGGTTDVDDANGEYNVYCYNLSQDNWTTLPPLPVRYFALGQVEGNLIAVGGKKKLDQRATNEIYSYDERTRKWKQTIPPMTTARFSSGILSLQSALIVAGGRHTPSSYTDIVEVYRPDMFQWYISDPLPTACSGLSLIAIEDTCYALGGYKYLSRLNQALYAPLKDLVLNAVPANQTTSGDGHCLDTQSAWKTLPNVPNTQPVAADLAGSLLAVGGKKPSTGANGKEIHMYLPAYNSWVYFSDLPAQQFGTAVAVLSSTEILVIGGYGNKDRMNCVALGTLHFKL